MRPVCSCVSRIHDACVSRCGVYQNKLNIHANPAVAHKKYAFGLGEAIQYMVYFPYLILPLSGCNFNIRIGVLQHCDARVPIIRFIRTYYGNLGEQRNGNTGNFLNATR